MAEFRLTKSEVHILGTISRPVTAALRNLGGSILAAAIEDYLSADDWIHRSADQFLYPTTSEYRTHYAWAVGLAKGVNPEWLRDALDRSRPLWDRQRAERMQAHRRPRQLTKWEAARGISPRLATSSDRLQQPTTGPEPHLKARFDLVEPPNGSSTWLATP